MEEGEGGVVVDLRLGAQEKNSFGGEVEERKDFLCRVGLAKPSR